MGESKNWTLRIQFDPSVKLEFHGAKVTSDGGLLLYRELDETLGLTALADEMFQDGFRQSLGNSAKERR